MNRRVAGVVLAAMIVPSMVMAQAPSRFMGDDGARSPEHGYNRLGAAGTSGIAGAGNAINLVGINLKQQPVNDDRTQPIVYEAYRRNPDGTLITPLQRFTVRIDPRTDIQPAAVQPNAKQWMEFLRDRLPRTDGRADIDFNGVPDDTQTPAPKALSNEPPRQTILVVDQAERQRRIAAGLPPEVPQLRQVTVVTRWTEARPRYENRTVVSYPCCCNTTFSVLVGYDYIPHVETTTRMENVADFPMTTIAVDRGILVTQGNPAYSTQIPRLCEFHYGPGATFTAPVVPLIANASDLPDVTLATGTTTTQGADTTATAQNVTNVRERGTAVATNQILDQYNRVIAGGGTTVNVPGSTTVITAPMTSPLIPGTAPNGLNPGGVVLQGNAPRVIDLPAEDRGTQTHIYTAPNGTAVKDKAYVADTLLSAGVNSTPPPPYQFQLK